MIPLCVALSYILNSIFLIICFQYIALIWYISSMFDMVCLQYGLFCTLNRVVVTCLNPRLLTSVTLSTVFSYSILLLVYIIIIFLISFSIATFAHLFPRLTATHDLLVRSGGLLGSTAEFF